MTAIEQLHNQCAAWVGQRNKLVDVYNSYTPHPRGYKVKYDDQLCATSVSAVMIQLGWTDIVPPECSVHYHWKQMTAIGKTERRSERRSAHTPEAGDLIYFYNKQTNTLCHIGIVDEVSSLLVYYYDTQSTWQRRATSRTNSQIYGYAFPDYSSKDVPEPEPQPKIQAGDLVSINPGAKWYNGTAIPTNVARQRWFVVQNKNGRAVLGMNEAKTSNICSPIREADLALVGSVVYLADGKRVENLLTEAVQSMDDWAALAGILNQILEIING